MRRPGFQHVMVVAMRAVFVALLVLLDVLAEGLFALFAGKDHFQGGLEGVRFRFRVAFGAVEPFPAWMRKVSGVERGEQGRERTDSRENGWRLGR